jgi:hypothetical protein
VKPDLLANLLSRRGTLSLAEHQALAVGLADVLTRQQAGTVMREWYRRDVDSCEAHLKISIPDAERRNVLLDYLRRTFTP